MSDETRWAKGIPEHTEEDILQGENLYAFCADAVAQNMQNVGYTIECIAYDVVPVQIIAKRNELIYNTLVAVDIFPYETRVSHLMKQWFVQYCKDRNYIPLLACVGIMSYDEIRAMHGLLLRDDDYRMRFYELVDLSNYHIPEPKSEEYHIFCIEMIGKAYKNFDFIWLYPRMAESVQFRSQWVKNARVGKSVVVNYFEEKSAAFQECGTQIENSTAVFIEPKIAGEILPLHQEDGESVALFAQTFENGERIYTMVRLQFDSEDMITDISIEDPDFSRLRPRFAYE